MLVSLTIKDLAIIEVANVELGPGLNVLTGETGAGKSIIVDALSLVLGDRARSDAVRHGCDRAEVCALFHLKRDGEPAREVARLDLDDPDEAEGPYKNLLIRRIIRPKGKGRVYVNGHLTTVGNLAAITRGLVDISSQHQHTTLLDPGRHLDLLDSFGGLHAERAAYEAAYGALTRAQAHCDTLRAAEQQRIQREDFVRFLLTELDALDPVDGEEELLAAEQARLAHADRLVAGSNTASELLAAPGSAGERLRDAGRELDRLVDVDQALAPLVERIASARLEVEDIAFELSRYSSGVDQDPRRLETVNERLDTISRMRRKHSANYETLTEARRSLRSELERFESLEIELKEAGTARDAARAEAEVSAKALSKARRAAAKVLEESVVAELHSLAMPGADLSFALTDGALGPRGVDAGEILIQTNPGEGFAAIARCASGGELSRVLLACKRALTHVDAVETAIFDEIDAGTGGAVADVIGLKLAEISAERQVIAITHLAQIAARGAIHLTVTKETVGARTATQVRRLASEERADEIARMLGGVEITSRVRAHAVELLSRGA